MLHAKRKEIADQLTRLPFANYRIPGLDTNLASNPRNAIPAGIPSLISNFLSAVISADMPNCLTCTRKLAGLGAGLTPAGDDFILGAVLAAWIIHPQEEARVLAEELTKTAAVLTTSLSATWLRSAGKGQTGVSVA